MKLNNKVVPAMLRATGAMVALVAIVEAGTKWN